MVEKISAYFYSFLPTSPSKKRLYGNFFSLSALQAINYLLPLITFPYLVRVLGPKKYGLIAFASSFASFFVIITEPFNYLASAHYYQPFYLLVF